MKEAFQFFCGSWLMAFVFVLWFAKPGRRKGTFEEFLLGAFIIGGMLAAGFTLIRGAIR